jgi:hypothetical protein
MARPPAGAAAAADAAAGTDPLAQALDRLAANPLVRPHWPSRSAVAAAAAAAAALAAAAAAAEAEGSTLDAAEVRTLLRPVLLANLDDRLTAAGRRGEKQGGGG